MRSTLLTLLCSTIAVLLFDFAHAQSPTPAAAPATTSTTNNASMQPTMKSLRELKDANEQILKKQQATLETLDELQKAAEQIKIFSKRG